MELLTVAWMTYRREYIATGGSMNSTLGYIVHSTIIVHCSQYDNGTLFKAHCSQNTDSKLPTIHFAQYDNSTLLTEQ